MRRSRNAQVSDKRRLWPGTTVIAVVRAKRINRLSNACAARTPDKYVRHELRLLRFTYIFTRMIFFARLAKYADGIVVDFYGAYHTRRAHAVLLSSRG